MGRINIFERPIQMAIMPDDNGKVHVSDPEERMYTLFITFIEGYDQEKTYKFICGQSAVREFVIEHVDFINFNESFISSWTVYPCSKDGFLNLVQFMVYLDSITDEDGQKWFDDGFDMQEYLEGQVEISTISDIERENFENAIHLSMKDSILVDINNVEEGEDI